MPRHLILAHTDVILDANAEERIVNRVGMHGGGVGCDAMQNRKMRSLEA